MSLRLLIDEHFTGNTDLVTNTAVPRVVGTGALRVVGQGIAETDSGAPILDVDGLNGVVQLTTTDEANHSCGIETAVMFDVALMGPLIFEVRVRLAVLPNETTEPMTVFVGFTDLATANYLPLVTEVVTSASSSTFTLAASDLCGFLMSSAQTNGTSQAEWHMVYNGGAATGETTAANIDAASDDAVAGSWQVLRLEILPAGNALWYIDGVLLQTIVGAVSTSVDMKFFAAVENLETATGTRTTDLDRVRIWASEDGTA